MNRYLILFLAGMAATQFGCTMAPHYSRPDSPVPSTWPAGTAPRETPDLNGISEAQWLTWQEFFTDQKLRLLITAALTHNRDLRVAALNVVRAKSLFGIQRAELFPTLDGAASFTRQRLPADLSGDNQARTFSRSDVNLGVVSWEVDFFGRIRSLKDRALDEYFASEQGRRAAQVLLVSQVADSFMALAADRDSLKLARTTLTTQQGFFALVKRRHELGLVPELDVSRAQTQVDSARVDAARFAQLVTLDQNALTLLLGSSLADDWLPAGLNSVASPREISLGLSSGVLLQRPDVLQAEFFLKAAFADIGAARAAFFPRITLTGAFGTASSELSGLFQAGSSAWTYAPQLVIPIFDARTWSAYKTANVQQEISLAQYERAIQTAFREVADALAVRRAVDEQVSAQESLVNAVADTYRLSNSRYDRGIDSYLSVLDAQRSLYAAEQGLVSLRLAKLVSQVRLYSVLGGGWQNQTPAATKTTSLPEPNWGKGSIGRN